MFQYPEFYHGFQINHFRYKQLINKRFFDLSDEEINSILDETDTGSKEELIKSVKIDIRFTFLLSVETLFELIFGLLPNDKGEINDAMLLKKIVEKNFFYEEIRKFNNREKSRLDLLEKDYIICNKKIPFIRHLFYFGIFGEELLNSIDNSLLIVRQLIPVLAEELAFREEYNSYKHGLRGISHISKLSIMDVDSDQNQIDFNFDDSLTFYSFNKQTGEHQYLTKALDWQKDIIQTEIVTKLINNIIQPRKTMYNKNKIKGDLPIYFLMEDDLTYALKSNVEIQDFIYTLTPDKKKI